MTCPRCGFELNAATDSGWRFCDRCADYFSPDELRQAPRAIRDNRPTPEIARGVLAALKPLRAADFVAEGAGEPNVPDLLAGMIPAGSLTLLVAHPKVGKSRLSRTICRFMETGGELCGREIKPGRSLYLALEERPNDVRAHLAQLGSAETLVVARPLRMSPETLLLLGKWIAEFQLALIVVDTLNRWWTVESGADRRQADVALAPLLDLAHTTGCTILVLHHLRKSAGSEGTDVAESNDLVAIADQVIYLRRDKDHERRRILQAPGLGRYPPVADLILEIGADGLYTGLGEAETIHAREENAALLDVLDDWLTVAEVAAATEIPEHTCRRRLKQLVAAGEIESVGAGSKGSPTRFRRFLTFLATPEIAAVNNNPKPPGFVSENDLQQPQSQGLLGLLGMPTVAVCTRCGSPEIVGYSPQGEPRCFGHFAPPSERLVNAAINLGATVLSRRPAFNLCCDDEAQAAPLNHKITPNQSW